jgi:site-specific DNA recombinase
MSRAESARRNRTPSEFLLRAGFLKCGECGHVMRAKRRWNEEKQAGYSHVYQCHSRYELPPTKCPDQAVSAKLLDKQVWKALEEFADEKNIAEIKKAIMLALENTSFAADIKAIDESVAKAEVQVRQYQEDLADTNLHRNARNLILADLSNTEERIEHLQHEKAMLEVGQVDMQYTEAQFQKILNWCQMVREQRDDLPYEDKRTFMRMLGVEVILHKRDKPEEDIPVTINFTIPRIAHSVFPQRVQERIESASTEGHPS